MVLFRLSELRVTPKSLDAGGSIHNTRTDARESWIVGNTRVASGLINQKRFCGDYRVQGTRGEKEHSCDTLHLSHTRRVRKQRQHQYKCSVRLMFHFSVLVSFRLVLF